jgi:hypothetical protein
MKNISFAVFLITTKVILNPFEKDISVDFVTKNVFQFTIKTAVGGFSFLFLNNLCQNRNKKSIGWFSH